MDDRRPIFLRAWREWRVLSMRDLAEASQVSLETVRLCETEGRRPQPSTVRKLAKALQTQPINLYRTPNERD